VIRGRLAAFVALAFAACAAPAVTSISYGQQEYARCGGGRAVDFVLDGRCIATLKETGRMPRRAAVPHGACEQLFAHARRAAAAKGKDTCVVSAQFAAGLAIERSDGSTVYFGALCEPSPAFYREALMHVSAYEAVLRLWGATPAGECDPVDCAQPERKGCWDFDADLLELCPDRRTVKESYCARQPDGACAWADKPCPPPKR
jgi:hypothetical protein